MNKIKNKCEREKIYDKNERKAFKNMDKIVKNGWQRFYSCRVERRNGRFYRKRKCKISERIIHSKCFRNEQYFHILHEGTV